MLIKISQPDWELNVWLELNEIKKLEQVQVTPWEYGCLKIGHAGSNVFWSCDRGEVSVLVGHDDQTWGFGVSSPVQVIEKIIKDISSETPYISLPQRHKGHKGFTEEISRRVNLFYLLFSLCTPCLCGEVKSLGAGV